MVAPPYQGSMMMDPPKKPDRYAATAQLLPVLVFMTSAYALIT